MPTTLMNDMDRFMDEQMFEEDVRAVLRMMRPNRRERLQGWKEYRTGGAHFRATISWDGEFEDSDPASPLTVPHMAEVLETILLGTARNADEINAAQEFELYRGVVRELYRRVRELQSSYE